MLRMYCVSPPSPLAQIVLSKVIKWIPVIHDSAKFDITWPGYFTITVAVIVKRAVIWIYHGG